MRCSFFQIRHYYMNYKQMYCEIQNETDEGATCAELPRLITKSESETANLLWCTTTTRTTIDTSVLPQLLSTIVNVQLVDVNYHVLILAYIISNFHIVQFKNIVRISFFEMEWYFIFVVFWGPSFCLQHSNQLFCITYLLTLA